MKKLNAAILIIAIVAIAAMAGPLHAALLPFVQAW